MTNLITNAIQAVITKRASCDHNDGLYNPEVKVTTAIIEGGRLKVRLRLRARNKTIPRNFNRIPSNVQYIDFHSGAMKRDWVGINFFQSMFDKHPRP